MMKGKQILAAVVGVLMLTIPVRALAGDHWRGNSRPQAWHDQGWHKGWFKHHQDSDDYQRGWEGRNNYQPRTWAWQHHEPDRDDYRYNPPVRHFEPDADDYYGGNYATQSNDYRYNASRPPTHPYRTYPYGSAYNGAGYNNPYYGNNYYGANQYGTNPSMGALGSLVGPLLGMTP